LRFKSEDYAPAEGFAVAGFAADLVGAATVFFAADRVGAIVFF